MCSNLHALFVMVSCWWHGPSRPEHFWVLQRTNVVRRFQTSTLVPFGNINICFIILFFIPEWWSHRLCAMFNAPPQAIMACSHCIAHHTCTTCFAVQLTASFSSYFDLITTFRSFYAVLHGACLKCCDTLPHAFNRFVHPQSFHSSYRISCSKTTTVIMPPLCARYRGPCTKCQSFPMLYFHHPVSLIWIPAAYSISAHWPFSIWSFASLPFYSAHRHALPSFFSALSGLACHLITVYSWLTIIFQLYLLSYSTFTTGIKL